MKIFVLLGLPIVLGITGQLCLKAGLVQIGAFPVFSAGIMLQMIKIFMNPFVFLGFTCYALSSVVWIITISRVPLSYAYPILSVNYVGILIGSRFIFGENVSLARWIGVMIICMGVILIGRS